MASSAFGDTDEDQTFGLILVQANPAIVLSERLLAVAEGGTYGVQLDSRPTGDEVVRVTSSDGTAASVASASLTYGTASSNTAQAVTVTGEEDGDVGDERVRLTHAVDAANSADEYDGAADATLPVTVTDDDMNPLMLSPAATTVEEGGSGAKCTVALTSAPTRPVTVAACPTMGAVGVAPAMLTFGAALVTVTVTDPSGCEFNARVYVALAPSVTANPAVAALTVSPAVSSSVSVNAAPLMLPTPCSFAAVPVRSTSSRRLSTARISAVSVAFSVSPAAIAIDAADSDNVAVGVCADAAGGKAANVAAKSVSAARTTPARRPLP